MRDLNSNKVTPGKGNSGEDEERKTTLTVSVDRIITANSLYANYRPNK